jgi:hypothetical protein
MSFPLGSILVLENIKRFRNIFRVMPKVSKPLRNFYTAYGLSPVIDKVTPFIAVRSATSWIRCPISNIGFRRLERNISPNFNGEGNSEVRMRGEFLLVVISAEASVLLVGLQHP